MRLLAHLGAFGLAALAVTTVGSGTTGAAPTVQDGRFLAADSIDLEYTCNGNDNTTNQILDSFGLQPFPMAVTVTSAAVEPSPSPGEDFDVEFTFDYTLDPAIVLFAIDLSVTSFTINSSSQSATATAGATGSASGGGAAGELPLGDGSVPVGFSQTITGTFNRTAAVDEPIEFTPGVANSGVLTSSGIQLQITCAPAEGVLTMVDQDGVAPTTTTTTRPQVVTTTTVAGATTTTAQVAAENESNELPRTGSSSNLMLVLVALGLIDLGYLALTASRQPRRRSVS